MGLFGNLIAQSGVFGDVSKLAVPQTITAPMATVQAGTVVLNGAGLGGVDTNPATGSPISGAGSWKEGFGLGGAQSAGAQAMGSGLGTFGFGPNGASLGGLSMGTSAALDMIKKHESGGRNILQQAVGPNGGFNPSTGTITGPSSASGYWQMINPTWRTAASMVGIDTKQYPTAMSAPYDLQRKAAGALFEKEGFAPWAPYNAALRADIARRGGAGAFTGKRADLDIAKDLEQSTGAATKSMADLGDAAAKLPDATSSATSSLSSFASSLFNFKPGEGGGINLAGLLGGGASSGAGMTDVATWSANGNIMTSRGPLRLNTYAGGGIATSPQLSIFGEGRTPEAYVPLPDGRSIPVTMKTARPATTTSSGSKNSGRGGPSTLVIDVRGTTGNSEISAMVERGIGAALQANNAGRDRSLSSRIANAQRRFG